MPLLSSARPSFTRLLGLGAARPRRTVASSDVGAGFGKDAGWVRARTGIEGYGQVDGAGELVALAHEAGRSAIAAARLDESDVDLVITASCSAATGPWDVNTLAAGVAPAAPRMQLNSACSGFSYAVSTADNLIRAGAAQRVLVVGAEHMRSLVDPADLGTSVIFGDGAGAAVVAASDRPGIGPAVWGSDGAERGLIDCGGVAGGRMRMAGRTVFRWAVESMPAVAREACARAGIGLDELDVFVPHQANLRIVDALTQKLGLTRAVVADDIVTVGNTSAASIPLALCRLLAEGRARSGQLALLLGFGAGLAWSGQVVELP
ncbi:ketoacyl-ACP synthase III [Jatrophihabitans fulvus]